MASYTDSSVDADLAAIADIPAVPKILEVICRTTGMGFAAVARVTESRWVACSVRDEIGFGLVPGDELRIETTLCTEVRSGTKPIIIDHVAHDDAYRVHPTPVMYGFQSYISVPIILPDRSLFGTLCAVDPQPRELSTPTTVSMFQLFAELIGLQVEASRRFAVTEASLWEERETSESRDRFIAVLGHDLRAPLAAINLGAELLGYEPLTEAGRQVVSRIQRSASRMAALIDDVLDFARARSGGGLTVAADAEVELGPVLRHVAQELQAATPGRRFELDLDIGLVRCDAARISQAFSNLLANALLHGAAESPIHVRGRVAEGALELSVANAGEPIPAETLGDLFKPFVRQPTRRERRPGLGLGLYIASEIARAHGGTLQVSSTEEETCFTLRIPA